MSMTDCSVHFCFKKADKFLFARYDEGSPKYAGCWALPSIELVSAARNDGGEVDHSWNDQLLEHFGVHTSSKTKSLTRATRFIDGKPVLIDIVSVEGAPDLAANSTFSEYSWMTLTEVISENGMLLEHGVSLLVQHEVALGNFAQNPYFLEVPPHLFSWEVLRSLSDDELWIEAAANYSGLKYGVSGGDGDTVRELSVDPYLREKLSDIPKSSSIVDVGCGNGELVSFLAEKGHQVVGYDLRPDELAKYNTNLFVSGSLLNLRNDLSGRRFDVVVMNLLLNWVADIKMLVDQVEALMTETSEVHITISAPEFSKNGEWDRNTTKPQWNIKKPTRREPFLTMVNRGIGPVRFHPHTLPELLCAFAASNLFCLECEHIFLDTCTPQSELEQHLADKPYLTRHIAFPAFLYVKLRRA